MRACAWRKRAEQWFDGQARDAEEVERHVASCVDCGAWVRQLRTLRSGAQAVAVRERIMDPQFPAFMAGIRDRLEDPERSRRSVWALLSATAAALIVAASVFFIVLEMSGGQRQAAATVVESASTDIENATVEYFLTDDGAATVWVNVSGKEIL